MSQNTFKNKFGPWSLVAGAAEGIGEAFCRELAVKAMNIVLVDIKKQEMEELAEKLEGEFGIQTVCLHTDLSKPTFLSDILPFLKNYECRLLIYNAAFSRLKSFIDYTSEELELFIATNTAAPLHLVHAFSRQLKERGGGGGILLMSSLAGLIGMQLTIPYAATKAFLWNLGESLHYELKPEDIDVLTCIAGATDTPAYRSTNPRQSWPRPRVMDAGRVARSTLHRMGRRARFIPGFSNRFEYFLLTRILPRSWAVGIANSSMKSLFGHHAQEGA